MEGAVVPTKCNKSSLKFVEEQFLEKHILDKLEHF